MATETGTVEIPTETTDEAEEAATAAAIERLLDPPQKSEEQEQPVSEEQQPTQETEQSPEAESETPAAEADDEDKNNEALPEDVQARIDKRIAKVVAQRKELEEQLAERETKLAEAAAKIKELSETPQRQESAPKAAPGSNDPILQVPEIKKVWDEEQKRADVVTEASDLLRMLRKDPEAAVAAFKERTKLDYDADDARDWLESVKDRAQTERMQFAQQRGIATERHVAKLEQEAQKYHDAALKLYPDLLDTKSKMGQRIQQLAKRMPALLNATIAPDGWQIISDLAAGQLAREAKVAVPAAPKAKPPTLASPAKAPIAPRTNGRPQAGALRKQAVESGNEADIDRALEAIL